MIATEMSHLSSAFRRLYCDPAVFESVSSLQPISLKRVLPFQSGEPVVDEPAVIHAEEAHLAQSNESTRQQLVEQYERCGLLEASDAANLRAGIGFYDGDFFELIGLVYANAGMFRCALRWYRERIAELESQHPALRCDEESVYASVGYALYSLGLFEEAIAWSKTCIGPRAFADALCQALVAYEVEPNSAGLLKIERSGSRTRYTINGPAPADVEGVAFRLKTAMKAFVPFHEAYIDWVKAQPGGSEPETGAYPFKAELDGGCLIRHKMNLIFATCCQTDALIEKGYQREAKRLLCEAALLEPEAGIIWERLRALV